MRAHKKKKPETTSESRWYQIDPLGRVNPLPNDKFLDWFKLKAFADNKINVTLKTKILFGIGRKHCGKRRKCWLPAFSPFPTMFSKGFFFRVIKSRDCLGQG